MKTSWVGKEGKEERDERDEEKVVLPVLIPYLAYLRVVSLFVRWHRRYSISRSDLQYIVWFLRTNNIWRVIDDNNSNNQYKYNERINRNIRKIDQNSIYCIIYLVIYYYFPKTIDTWSRGKTFHRYRITDSSICNAKYLVFPFWEYSRIVSTLIQDSGCSLKEVSTFWAMSRCTLELQNEQQIRVN